MKTKRGLRFLAAGMWLALVACGGAPQSLCEANVEAYCSAQAACHPPLSTQLMYELCMEDRIEECAELESQDNCEEKGGRLENGPDNCAVSLEPSECDRAPSCDFEPMCVGAHRR